MQAAVRDHRSRRDPRRIEAGTYKGAKLELEQEIQQIVDSINLNDPSRPHAAAAARAAAAFFVA